MNAIDTRILLVLTDHPANYVKALPEFEPYALVLLGSLVQDLAQVEIIDLRFENHAAFKKKLLTFKPHIVGIRVHTAADTDAVLETACVCKRLVPEVLTVLGGQGVTMQPHDFAVPSVDVLCFGHADVTFRELVQAFIDGKEFGAIPGLGLINGQEVIVTEPRQVSSEELSWPPLNRDLLKKYLPKYDAQLVVTSMGCPFRCSFCALWIIPEGAYLLRKPEEIVEDIAGCETNRVHFADDNTFHNKAHAMRLYQLLKEREITKKFSGYARTDTINRWPELFENWASIGLKELVVGFEGFKEDELNFVNKRNSADENDRALRILEDCGITPLAHFIIFPHYTRKDFQELWDYIDKRNITDPWFPPLTPIPGTKPFSQLKREDQLTIFDLSWFNLEYMVQKTTLPKWLWYLEYMKIWMKSLSFRTYLKRRKAVGWTFSAFIARSSNMARVFPYYTYCIAKQLYLERQIRKNGKPANLKPSFDPEYESPFVRRVLAKIEKRYSAEKIYTDNSDDEVRT